MSVICEDPLRYLEGEDNLIRMKNFTFRTVVLFFLVTGTAEAKRLAPVVIEPILREGIEYAAEHKDIYCDRASTEACGMRLSVVARDKKTAKEKWNSVLYVKLYNAKLEKDPQRIFPQEFEWISGGSYLRLVDEKKLQYAIDPKNGKLIDSIPIFYRPAMDE